MIDRRLAILSGVHTRVAAKIGPQLRSLGIEIAFVDTDRGINSAYFERLTLRTLHLAERILTRPDVRLYSVLASCLEDTPAKRMEFDFFFPALRRLSFPRTWQKDLARAPHFTGSISEIFQSHDYKKLANSALHNREQRLLLPVRNAKLPRLARHFEEIYEFRSSELSRRLDRDIVRRRGGYGYRIAGVDFNGAVNDGTHPIRRCTDTCSCDLKALMRFGVLLPDRFEFDVSCATGLAGKTFYLCNGNEMRIPDRASHLNMRVNDDFVIGKQ